MLEGLETYGTLLGVGFVLGILVMLLLRNRKAGTLEERTLELGKSINSLKAEKNVFERKLATADQRVDELDEALKERDRKIEELETAFEARSDQLEQTRTDLKAAVQQTQELRRDLADHAEETIRAEAKARDVENELSMLTSGDTLDEELREEILQTSDKD
ncbi:MAG: hypothetical protein AAGC71_05380 [Pseudomonadota bacterium]